MGEFGWNAYYREMYERCRRENLALAGKLADAERRRDELSEKYGRIAGNPLYRLTAPFRLAGRAAGKAVRLLSDSRGARPASGSCGDKSVLEAYRAELCAQKWPYRRWIDEAEAGQKKDWPSEGLSFDGYWMLTCEEGAGEAGALAWCCEQMRRDGTLLAYTHEDFSVPDGEEGRRCMPWMKPAWQPDTFLSFFSMGSLVLVEETFAKAVAAGMKQTAGAASAGAGMPGAAAAPANPENVSADPAAAPAEWEKKSPEPPLCRVDRLWLYDFCLRAQEMLEAKGEEPRLLDAVSFHRYVAEAQDVPEVQTAPGTQEMPEAQTASGLQEMPEAQTAPGLQEMPEARLARELAAGAYVWGYTEEYLPVKRAALARRGLKGDFAKTKEPEVLAFVPEAIKEDGKPPLVSVIIPSKDHPEVLERCVRSIRERTAYPDYEIIVVDNGSGPEALPQLERIARSYALHYCIKEMPFNFSRMCRAGAAKAGGSLLLFLNNDVEVIEENWLQILAGQACQPHVGAVGAKLYYPEGERIQHDGVVNMGIGPSHKLASFSDGQWYYFGQNRFTQDCLAVTGACLCVRKALWEELGGFDEKMPVAYNDVDFCFRLYEAGYTNVLRNDAVLYHHESLSRGLDEQTEEKWDRLLLEKERLYAKQPEPLPGRVRIEKAGRDPYYSVHLAQDVPEYVIAPAGEEQVHLHTEAPEPLGLPEKRLKKYTCRLLHVTADRAGRQLKIHRQEPEIYLLDGWSYVEGADNCRYERWLTLLPSCGTEPESGQSKAPGGPQGTEAVRREMAGLRPALQVPLAGKYRPDVEAILPGERHIGLAGYEVRLLRRDLQAGPYRIGLLCRDRETGTYLYRETGRLLCVEA